MRSNLRVRGGYLGQGFSSRLEWPFPPVKPYQQALDQPSRDSHSYINVWLTSCMSKYANLCTVINHNPKDASLLTNGLLMKDNDNEH